MDTKALRDNVTASAKVRLSPCFNVDPWPSNLTFWVLCCSYVSDGGFITQRVQESWNRKTAAGRPTSENDPSHECDRGERYVASRLSLSPSTSRPYSPLVCAVSGSGLATPGIGAPPSLFSAAGGSGEDLGDFRIGLVLQPPKRPAVEQCEARTVQL